MDSLTIVIFMLAGAVRVGARAADDEHRIQGIIAIAAAFIDAALGKYIT